MPFQRILMPIDGAPDTQTLIDYSDEIASTLRAELHLLHVARNPAAPDPSYRVSYSTIPSDRFAPCISA